MEGNDHGERTVEGTRLGLVSRQDWHNKVTTASLKDGCAPGYRGVRQDKLGLMEGPLGRAHKYSRSSSNTLRAGDEGRSVLTMEVPADNGLIGGEEERCSNKRKDITCTKNNKKNNAMHLYEKMRLVFYKIHY